MRLNWFEESEASASGRKNKKREKLIASPSLIGVYGCSGGGYARDVLVFSRPAVPCLVNVYGLLHV